MKKRALVLNGGNLDPSGIKRSVQVPIELGAIRAPTLVLAGTRDMVKESHTRLIAKEYPGGEAVNNRGGPLYCREEAGEVQCGGGGVFERN